MSTFNRRAALAVVLIALIVGGFAFSGSAAPAKDAPGCEGLAAYRAAMFKIGRDLHVKMAAQGLPATRDIITYSSADWATYAQDAGDFQSALKTITPPAFAADWHQSEIERNGLLQQVGLLVSKSGVIAINAFVKPLTDISAKRDAAVISGTKSCADFKQFTLDYQALSGVNAQGTPVATPAD